MDRLFECGDATVWQRGVQARLAQRFDVSRSTICRDVKEIRRWITPTPCPICGSALSTARYEDLVALGKIERPRRNKRAEMDALKGFCALRGDREVVDATQLTQELILHDAAWHDRARVVALEEDQGVGMALVDQAGDGTDLVATFWMFRTGIWHWEGALMIYALDTPVSELWEDGPMAWAVGRSTPGKTTLVRYRGGLHRCQANEYGIWAFARQTDQLAAGELPQIIGQLSGGLL
jgi:hypothetical protein